jgi:hypothetical protein
MIRPLGSLPQSPDRVRFDADALSGFRAFPLVHITVTRNSGNRLRRRLRLIQAHVHSTIHRRGRAGARANAKGPPIRPGGLPVQGARLASNCDVAGVDRMSDQRQTRSP